jgi:hypothetical protein
MAQAERASRPSGAGTTDTGLYVDTAAERDKVFPTLAAKPSVDDNLISNTRALRVLCQRHGIDLLDSGQTPAELRHLNLASVLSSCAPLLDICVQVIQHDQMWPAGHDDTVSCPYVMAPSADSKETGSHPCVLQMTARAEAFLLRLVYDAWRSVLPRNLIPSPSDTVWWNVLAQYIRTGVSVSNGWGVNTTRYWKDAGICSMYMEPESEGTKRSNAGDEEWDATIQAARILAEHITIVAYPAADRRMHPNYSNLECLWTLSPICQFASRTRGVMRHIRNVATADQQALERTEDEAPDICAALPMANGLTLQLSTGAMEEIASHVKAAWVAAVPNSSFVRDEDWLWEQVVRVYFKAGVRIQEGWGVRATAEG